MNDVLQAYAVENMLNDGLEDLEIAVGFGAQPLVVDSTPQGLHFVEVRAVGGQVKKGGVQVFPMSQARLKGGAVVNFGVIEHQHGGAGACGGLGIGRIGDKGRVERAFAGGGVQVVGGGVVAAQHVETLTMARQGGDLFAGKLPGVGQGRGQAKARFAAVI